MTPEKYYIFCYEGWYEKFDNIEKAKEYICDNFGCCEILIKGTKIEYNYENIKLEKNIKNYDFKSPIELLLHDLEYITNHLKKAYTNNEYIDNKFWGNYLHHIALAIYNKNEATND